jgi:aminoglycoside phosphotransferase (APT) family kinase protein
LKALEGTNVPHPKLIASCADEAVFGVSFYVMEAVEGFNATSSLPALHRASPEIRRSMGLALADGAAALGRIDYQAVGLADFGRPQGYLQRQVSRWRSQLTGYERYGSWPGWAQLPGVEEIAAYLESRQPTSFKPGLLHGDYSLGNVLYRNDSPQLAAIIDWELATIGDPLLDLGWILCTWRGDPAGDLNVLVVEPWDGFPTPEELVERYAQNSSRDLSRIDWYVVLACYKLAIILEGTYARACAGLDPPQTGAMLHETATLLFQRALRRMEREH